MNKYRICFVNGDKIELGNSKWTRIGKFICFRDGHNNALMIVSAETLLYIEVIK